VTREKEDAFDALLESDLLPEVRRPTMGRTLPFVKARISVDEVYRLAQAAESPSELVLLAARTGPDELAAALRSLDGQGYRGFALLYAAQKADKLVAEDPNKALALAKLIFEEAETLPLSNRKERITTPAPREAVQAEAVLLESQAFIQKGDADSARNVIAPARRYFRESGDLGFGAALCDYYEGQAAGFANDYVAAESLLKRALAVFSEFGQGQLIGRGEAALGTVLGQRGDAHRALVCFDRALEFLDPETDSRPLTMVLNNRAHTLARLGRFDEARATFARALNLARRHGYKSSVFFVRTGLADLDFRRGQYARALRTFIDLSREAGEIGAPMQVLFARLYVAECHARLGSYGPMATEVEALRRERQANPFSPSPALGELFVCLDQGTIDADLIAHVREYLQDEQNGVKRAYRPLRLVG
jgi:tetratricopeptide (TPR) repeat protein